MYYKTLQLIQHSGKKTQSGSQVSWFNKPAQVDLPFNQVCARLFPRLEPNVKLTQEQLAELRTELIRHTDINTQKQLNILDWACQIEEKDPKLPAEVIYMMAKILSDLWPESFEELYYTLPESQRKQAFMQRYFTIWKGDARYGTQAFSPMLTAHSHIAQKTERASHAKLFDLLKVLSLDPNGNIYPDYEVNKVIFKLPPNELILEGGNISERFREGLKALSAKTQGKISDNTFNLIEKYFSFSGLLGMDTTFFYAIVKNKYGNELPSQTVFGFEYDQIVFDIGENKAKQTSVVLEIKKRLTEVYIDDESQTIIKIEPPLLVHSLLHVFENNGKVEAKLENLTTVNYSKFIAAVSTHILKKV